MANVSRINIFVFIRLLSLSNLVKTIQYSPVQLVDINNIFLPTALPFDEYCTEVFNFQYQNNAVYREWVDLIHPGLPVQKIPHLIPALPISFFKERSVVAGIFEPEKVFESSGTTGIVTSRHLVKSLDVYERSFMESFQHFYGDIRDWCVLALLPAYLERANSSLVYMADRMIRESNHPNSGFYLYNYAELAQTIQQLEAAGQKTLLLGVTFALLDFSAAFPQQLQHTVVMETGGMKGRGKELTRADLHDILTKRLGVERIHAEYGMTELLSQAFSTGAGRYICPPWMKVYVRSEDDPLSVATTGSGILQIVDLANIYSCSFIATQDVGTVYEDGSFEVLGRMDNSDLRGCSLLVV